VLARCLKATVRSASVRQLSSHSDVTQTTLLWVAWW